MSGVQQSALMKLAPSRLIRWIKLDQGRQLRADYDASGPGFVTQLNPAAMKMATHRKGAHPAAMPASESSDETSTPTAAE